MVNRFSLFCLFLLLAPTLRSDQQELRPDAHTSNIELILNTPIPEFDLNNETIEVGLKRLASGPAGFAMGFEHELKSKLKDPPIQDPTLTLHLKLVTAREALNAMCHADGRYTWSTDDTFINVYPTKTLNDLSYFLNRRLKRLDLDGLTDVQQGLLAIVNELPPPKEQVAIARLAEVIPTLVSRGKRRMRTEPFGKQ